MSESTARAKIVALLESISGIGQVHDCQQKVDTKELVVEKYVKNGQLHVWEVKLADGNGISEERYPGFNNVTYTFDLIGQYGFVANKSDAAWQAFVDSVMAAFRANMKLRNLVVEAEDQVIDAGPPVVRESLVAMVVGEYMVHYTRIEMRVREHLRSS